MEIIFQNCGYYIRRFAGAPPPQMVLIIRRKLRRKLEFLKEMILSSRIYVPFLREIICENLQNCNPSLNKLRILSKKEM